MAIKLFAKPGSLAALLLWAAIFFTGCQSPESINTKLAQIDAPDVVRVNPSGTDLLSKGELLTIIFSDTPPPALPPFEERIKDDGTITLIYNKTFVAAGKMRGQLEREIRTNYVPAYFKELTVTIKPQARFYSVYGYVNRPNEIEYKGRTTVLQAIAAAGGFNDFAQPKKVRLTRSDGQNQIVDCKKALDHPELDLPVYPGDKVYVPKRKI
jgi:protein involved in polysaccharide export with SLBB domain